MKALQMLRAMSAASLLVALTVLFASAVMAQGNYTNTGSIVNTGTMTVANFDNTAGTVDNSTGTIKVKGAITNPTANNFDTQTGTVEYTGSSAAQTITSSVKSATYGNLAGRSGGTKSLGGNITVSGTVTSDSATTVVDVATYTLTVPGASPIVASAGGAFTAASGTVNYTGDVAQSVYPTTYANLTTSGATASRSKTATGNVTVTGNVTNGANNTLDFSTFSFTGTGATFSNAATIRSAGSVSLTAAVAVPGTFEYYASTGTQTVAGASYVNLTLSAGSGATGQKNFSSGTTSVSGTYAAAGADRNYGTGTFVYAGTSQNVIGEPYFNLTFSGTGLTDIKTATGNLTVGGNFVNTLGTGNMSTFTFGVTGTKTNSGKMQFAGLSNGVVFGDGIVEYNGTTTDAATQTIALGTYNTLLFSNNAPKNVTGGTVHTLANLTVSAGVTANVSASGILTVANDMSNAGTVNNAGSIAVGN